MISQSRVCWVLFVLVLIVPAGAALAAGDAAHGRTLRCDAVLDDPHTLHFKTNNGERYYLVDYAFEGGPFISPMLACARWLEQGWEQNSLLFRRQLQFKPLLDERRKIARLTGISRRLADEACLASQLCRIAFPYNLTRGLMTQVGQNLFPTREIDPVCRHEPPRRARRAAASRLAISDRVIDDATFVHLGWAPRDSYAEVLSGWMRDQDNLRAMVVSTYTLEPDEIRPLKALADERGIPLLIIFDLVPLMHRSQLGEYFALADDRTYLLPIANRPDKLGAYHIKGAVGLPLTDAQLEGADDVVFTSLNLEPNDNLWSLDLIGRLRSVKMSHDLRAILINEWRAACDAERYFNCSLDIRFGLNDQDALGLKETFARSCRLLHDLGVSSGERLEPRYALHSLTHAVDASLAALINGSTKSLIGTTQRFGQGAVADAIDRVLTRDETRVAILVGEPDSDVGFVERNPVRDFMDRWFKGGSWQHVPTDQGFGVRYTDFEQLAPRLKAMVIDDAFTFWGTGNWTQFGLRSASEVFFLIKSQTLANEVKRVVYTLGRAHGWRLPKMVLPAQPAARYPLVWNPSGQTLGDQEIAAWPLFPRLDFFVPKATCLDDGWRRTFFITEADWRKSCLQEH